MNCDVIELSQLINIIDDNEYDEVIADVCNVLKNNFPHICLLELEMNNVLKKYYPNNHLKILERAKLSLVIRYDSIINALDFT